MAEQVMEAAVQGRFLPMVGWEEQPARKKVTYEEFLAWCDEDTWAEWVDGEVIVFSPAHNRHQDIAGFLESVLRIYGETRGPGVVRSAPFQMKMARGREPDLLFIAREHLDRLQETYLDGPADVVVEILSRDSQSRDRGDKFFEYAEGGVPEYWLIDPIREWAEFYSRDERGHYQPILTGHAGVFHSQAVPGFWLRLEWLWQPPPVLEVLRELEII
jgi:Uma2 family endonuclease